MPLAEGEAELEAAPELAPDGTPLLEDPEPELAGTPPEDEEAGAELDGAALEEWWIVSVELPVRVMVL